MAKDSSRDDEPPKARGLKQGGWMPGGEPDVSPAVASAMGIEDGSTILREGAEADREACLELILQLRSRGIRDSRVLGAIERVPRRLFLSARQHVLAYVDTQLPIECGQTAPAPSAVAAMLQHLDLQDGHKVLEVGVGSGYQTALLSRLARQVVGLERYRTLTELARQRLATLKITNVEIVQGDGLTGHPDAGPYDRIILGGSLGALPEAVLGQLSADGVAVLARGEPGKPQTLLRVARSGQGFAEREIGTVRLVPLSAGVAARL